MLAHILRDPHEAWKKCSLLPLRERPDLRIINTAGVALADFQGYTLLTPLAPPLTAADAGHLLMLVDASWRRAGPILRDLAGRNAPRSIPPVFRSAYPRRSEIYADPASGLSTVEALYLALRILGHRDDSLLAGYHWREDFLASNRVALEGYPINRDVSA